MAIRRSAAGDLTTYAGRLGGPDYHTAEAAVPGPVAMHRTHNEPIGTRPPGHPATAEGGRGVRRTLRKVSTGKLGFDSKPLQ